MHENWTYWRIHNETAHKWANDFCLNSWLHTSKKRRQRDSNNRRHCRLFFLTKKNARNGLETIEHKAIQLIHHNSNVFRAFRRSYSNFLRFCTVLSKIWLICEELQHFLNEMIDFHVSLHQTVWERNVAPAAPLLRQSVPPQHHRRGSKDRLETPCPLGTYLQCVVPFETTLKWRI